MKANRGDYIFEIKVRDKSTGQLIDEGKVVNVRGWDWLINKYGSSLFKLSWQDIDKIWNMNPEELVKYVEHKRESWAEAERRNKEFFSGR